MGNAGFARKKRQLVEIVMYKDVKNTHNILGNRKKCEANNVFLPPVQFDADFFRVRSI